MRLSRLLSLLTCAAAVLHDAWEVRLGDREMFDYHKDLFPMDMSDLLCFAVAGASVMVASGGGVGGGGILVPLYMLFLNFRPRHAVALSNFTILGGALANTMVNVFQVDENGRSLIDWDIIVMMEPATIAGTIVGSFASKYLADFVLMVFLATVLAMLAFRTLDKGMDMFRHENESAGCERATALPQDEEEVPSDGEERDEIKESNNLVGGRTLRTVDTAPWLKVFLLVVCFAGCVVLTILKGSGHGSVVGVECGSVSFWLLSWATLPWVLGFGLIFRDMLINEHLEKEEDGHDFQESEIRWTAATTVRRWIRTRGFFL
ncbi:unnamed protein product [Effrenium voratum]|nr:unnamed protein product [Effrenium voratum]